MRKKLRVLLIILVTIGCIFLGIKTREASAISVTQLKTNSENALSYMIETKENNIIMIDGGNYEDSEHLEEVLIEKGGVVDSWFITLAQPKNFGAMQKIIENGKIQINHIYISFNTMDWYQTYEPDKVAEISDFLDLLYSEAVISKVQDVPNRYEVLIDNLYVTVLNVKNAELNGEFAGFNQSMVIKVNNTYKSMIFMGNIANEAAEKFKDNNLDEIDCDAVQVSNNGVQDVDDEIYKKMTPEYLFITASNKNYLEELKSILEVEESYISVDGDVSVKIW